MTKLEMKHDGKVEISYHHFIRRDQYKINEN